MKEFSGFWAHSMARIGGSRGQRLVGDAVVVLLSALNSCRNAKPGGEITGCIAANA